MILKYFCGRFSSRVYKISNEASVFQRLPFKGSSSIRIFQSINQDISNAPANITLAHTANNGHN